MIPLTAEPWPATQLPSSLNRWRTVCAEIIDGGDDADEVHGSRNADRISGGAGNDHIHHSQGTDVISGGDDQDKYVVRGTEGDDNLRLVAKVDRDDNYSVLYYVNGIPWADLMNLTWKPPPSTR